MGIDEAIIHQVRRLQRRSRRGVFPVQVQVWLAAEDARYWRCEWAIRRRMGRMAASGRLMLIDVEACVGLSLVRIGGANARQGYRVVEHRLPRFRMSEGRPSSMTLGRAA